MIKTDARHQAIGEDKVQCRVKKKNYDECCRFKAWALQ